MTVGESMRIIREMTGIPRWTISAIENDRINLGVERAKVIARALECHPAVPRISRMGRRCRIGGRSRRSLMQGSCPQLEKRR